MSTTRSLSRRTALAGLSAGSLGLLFGTHAAALSTAPNRETGGVSGSSMVSHPLTGLWLAHISLSADTDTTAAVPAFFGVDGSAVLVYPCAESTEAGAQIRGLALGTWAPIDDYEARFTAVQVCFGADGAYRGTRTYDTYPIVSGDGKSFTVRGESDLVTVRDASNTIAERRIGSLRLPMYGFRMAPGDPGFPTSPDWPEVAPVHPGDPRLAPTPVPTPEPGSLEHQ